MTTGCVGVSMRAPLHALVHLGRSWLHARWGGDLTRRRLIGVGDSGLLVLAVAFPETVERWLPRGIVLARALTLLPAWRGRGARELEFQRRVAPDIELSRLAGLPAREVLVSIR